MTQNFLGLFLFLALPVCNAATADEALSYRVEEVAISSEEAIASLNDFQIKKPGECDQDTRKVSIEDVELDQILNLEKQAWNLTASQAKQIQRFLINSLSALGLNLKNLPKIPAKIGQMAQKRELCRINKQFIQSDALRNEIEKLGYIIEDTPAGPLVIKK